MRRLSVLGAAAFAAFTASAVSAQTGEMPDSLSDDASFETAASDDHVETLPELDPIESDDSAPLPLRFQASLQGMLALPFAGERGSAAFGFALTYGVGYGDLPLMLGVDFMSASSSTAASFELPAAGDGDTLVMQKNAQSRTLFFDLWLRVQPPRWVVRPYVEGFVGAKLASVRYALNRSGADTEDATSGTADEWTRSLGYGAGVDFAGLFKLADAVSITLGVRRLHGPHSVFTLRADVDGREVSTRQHVASAVTLFSLGIMGWLDRSAPAEE